MLYLHHSNCLVELASILREKLRVPSGNILEPEKILVQNPGMKRWLQQQISQHTGISANLDFPLPTKFIWDVYLSEFETNENLAAWDSEALRWRLMTILGQAHDIPELKLLWPYLKDDDGSISRFQLAVKLAELFSQYLIYRPNMIGKWERGGKADNQIEAWQAHIWRLLNKQSAKPHRAAKLNQLIQRLSEAVPSIEKKPKQMYVFAISSLSPLYMNVLSVLANKFDVHFFILNPCYHYWGDIQSKREQLKQNQKNELEVENELLASLGKQGQEYIDYFYDNNLIAIENHEFIVKPVSSVLSLIQNDILTLNNEEAGYRYNKDDQSIKISCCYSELRELQVLHDHLLHLMEKDNSLKPHDIVVMSPNIDSLAPYIEAVFGYQNNNLHIPFAISEQNLLLNSQLIQTILEWIKIPSSRFTANEVLGWLELKPLQRAYELDGESIEVIRYWVENNHIHWGLNAEQKKKHGFAELDLNTWKFGIDKLLTAYLMDPSVTIEKTQVAAESIMTYTEFLILGRLQKLLDDLSTLAFQFSNPTSLLLWQKNINSMIDQCFDLLDEDEEIIKPLRDEMSEWIIQSEETAFNEVVNKELIHSLLEDSLSKGFMHNQYLTGRINFCNLIPMRSLPFRVVCLIGLTDAAFPVKEIPVQFDLISMYPKKGDRSKREDDRYLFLQSLLAAQEQFYLSYIGKNRRDDSLVEPSVLISELQNYIKQRLGEKLPISETTLQVFSKQNFQKGSYAINWLANEKFENIKFNQPIQIEVEQEKIKISELEIFYKNPAKYYLEKSLNMSLNEKVRTLDDDEVFSMDPLQKYIVKAKLLENKFDLKTIIEEQYLQSGEFPEQNIGQFHLAERIIEAEELFKKIVLHERYEKKIILPIQINIGETELTGNIISYASNGLLQYSLSKLSGKQIFPYWINHCILCVLGELEFSQVYFRDKSIGFTVLNCDDAKEQLEIMIEGYFHGVTHGLALFADTAYKYETLRVNKSEEQAKKSIEEDWSEDAFYPASEFLDIHIRTCFKNSSPLSEPFYEAVRKYMKPLVSALEIR